MKKLCLSLLLVLPLCSFAQKGMQSVGGGIMTVGFGDLFHDDLKFNPPGGIGFCLKYDYHLTDRVGFSANITLFDMGVEKLEPYLREIENTPNRPAKIETVYELVESYHPSLIFYITGGLDARFYMNEVKPFRPYLFSGIDLGMQFLEADFVIGLRAGLGFNWRLTYNCLLQIELPFNAKWSKWYCSSYDHLYDEGGLVYCTDWSNFVHDYNKFPYIEREYNTSTGWYDYYNYDNYYDYVYRVTCNRSMDFFGFTPSVSILYTF